MENEWKIVGKLKKMEKSTFYLVFLMDTTESMIIFEAWVHAYSQVTFLTLDTRTAVAAVCLASSFGCFHREMINSIVAITSSDFQTRNGWCVCYTQ